LDSGSCITANSLPSLLLCRRHSDAPPVHANFQRCPSDAGACFPIPEASFRRPALACQFGRRHSDAPRLLSNSRGAIPTPHPCLPIPQASFRCPTLACQFRRRPSDAPRLLSNSRGVIPMPRAFTSGARNLAGNQYGSVTQPLRFFACVILMPRAFTRGARSPARNQMALLARSPQKRLPWGIEPPPHPFWPWRTTQGPYSATGVSSLLIAAVGAVCTT
jgi:hypothetical protein